MKNRKIWTIFIILALAVTTFFFRDSITTVLENQVSAQATTTGQEAEDTVTIRPATDATQVSAAGNIALVEQQTVAFQVEGIISEVAVEASDKVTAGDLLAALDTTDLERAVQQAELSLQTSQTDSDKLLEPADAAEITAAQASVTSAQAKLAELEAGPSAAELAAAQTALTAAEASYQELLDGQSEAEITQASVDLHKAFITLQQAQEAYNQIAYADTVGSSSQAMELQDATIDYDATKAAYDIATAPASEAEVQAALQSIKEAQVQLEDLNVSKADMAAAKADVASAEATLTDLLNGPTEAEVREVELAIEQARLDLQEAEAQLSQARLRAPTDGTVLSVEIEVGQQASNGLEAVSLADLSALELPVYVAEVDISKVQLGQPASITIDALPDQVFSGEVSRIAPTSESDSGVINYEVTIRLNDLKLEDGVRPGMTAVATINNETGEPGWLVPSNALTEFEGETSVVVIRDGQEIRVEVTPGTSQGEWTVVQSPDLQSGDQVVGEVATFVDDDENTGGGPFGGPPPPN